MPSAEFTAAAKSVQELSKTPADDELLELYGLYKQATVGDNDTERPSAFNFKAKYKWDSWDKLKGKSQEDAEQEYIALVKSLAEKYN